MFWLFFLFFSFCQCTLAHWRNGPQIGIRQKDGQTTIFYSEYSTADIKLGIEQRKETKKETEKKTRPEMIKDFSFQSSYLFSI